MIEFQEVFFRFSLRQMFPRGNILLLVILPGRKSVASLDVAFEEITLLSLPKTNSLRFVQTEKKVVCFLDDKRTAN